MFSTLHSLPLLACALSLAAFRKCDGLRRNLKNRNPTDVSMFSWAVDTGLRFPQPNLPNCYMARQVNVSAKKSEDGDLVLTKTLKIKDCVRCTAGYIEMPHLANFTSENFTWTGYLQKCDFLPCGEACEDCWVRRLPGFPFRKMRGKLPKVHYFCDKCRPTSLSHTTLVDMSKTKSVVNARGEKMSIQAQCLPFSNFRNVTDGEVSLSAADTLIPLVSRLIRPPTGQLSRAEQNPFEMVSLAETFVIHATREFQSMSTGSLAGKGEAFLAKLTQELLAKFKVDDRENIGRTLATSSVIADTRGALSLCRDIAMLKIGSTSKPADDERWEASLKLCTGIELVFAQLRQYTTPDLEEGRQGTVFSDEQLQTHVPRRVLVMLNMFDGILP